MRLFFRHAAIIVMASLMVFSLASADSVDDHIKNLKDENAEIRAKAAYELGCG